jgi:transketolase
MKNYINTGSKDTRSGFGAGMTELGQKKTKTWWHFVLI